MLYELIKDENVSGATKLKLISSWDRVFSLDLLNKNDDNDLDDEFIKCIEEKIKIRSEAKKNKDFMLADEIRKELLEKGIELKDTREGTIWNKI